MSATLVINNQRYTPLEAQRLGHKLLTARKLPEAAAVFQLILHHYPSHAETLVSQGQLDLLTGNPHEALFKASRAHQAKPEYLKTYHLAINAVTKVAPLAKSLTWCEKGLQQHPTDPALLLHRALLHNRAQESADVLRLSRQVIQGCDAHDVTMPIMALSLLAHHTDTDTWDSQISSLKPEHLHPLAAATFNLYRHIGCWLADDAATAASLNIHNQQALSSLDIAALTPRNAEEHKALQTALQNLKGYLDMFDRLPPAPTPDATLPALYMVGDSHVVAAHRQTVNLQGTPHQLRGKLSMGCKMWHLADPEMTYGKHQAQTILESLPSGAPVIMSVGEIDARANEGIWPLAQKTGKPATQLIEATVAGAIAFVQAHASHLGPIIWAGIPAPVSNRQTPDPAYAAMVTAFNQHLQQAAHAAKHGFLDLHDLTAQPDGFSNETWHLEDTHLQPTALPHAFQHHYLPA